MHVRIGVAASNRALHVLSLAALLLVPAVGAAQSVLVLDDTPEATEGAAAAAALGLEVVSTRTITGFVSAYDSRETWDLLVFDVARIVFTADLLGPLEDHLAKDGAVILAHGNVDGNGALRDVLDLDCADDPHTFAIVSTPVDGYDLFDLAQVVPSPLTGTSRHPDNGDLCTPRSGGMVLARLGSAEGPPAIVTTRRDQVLFNGILLDSLRSATAPDADADSVPDVVELLQNEMLVALDLQVPGIVVYGDAPAPEAGRLAAELEIDIHRPGTLAELDALIAEDDYFAVYFSFANLSAVDAAVMARIEGLAATETPVLFFSPDFDSANGWSSYFGLTLDRDLVLAEAIVPGDTALSSAVFTDPNPLADLPVTRDLLDDSGDAIAASDRLVPVAFFEGGGIAAVAAPEGGLVVGSFRLSEMGAVDADLDGLSDSTEFLVNLRQFAVGAALGPPALVLTDVLESGSRSQVAEACAVAGFHPLFADSPAMALASVERDPLALVAVEGGVASGLDLDAPDLVAALTAWTRDMDGPIVVASTDLDAAPELAAVLGVEVTADRDAPSAIVQEPAHLGGIFRLPEPTPAMLGAAAAVPDDWGDSLRVAQVGGVAARFTDGAPAVVTTGNGRRVIFGTAPVLFGQGDTDRNRIPDAQQLLVGAIRSVVEPRASLVLTTAETNTIVADAAQTAGLRAHVVATPTAFVQAWDEGDFAQVAIDASYADVVADAAVLSRVQDRSPGAPPLVVAWPEFDAYPEAAAALGAPAVTDAELEQIVEPRDSAGELFRTFFTVPSPLGRTHPTGGDQGDAFAPGSAVVGARYGHNLGPAATVLVRDGTVSLNGFRPDQLAAGDRDGDGLDDRTAFFANQMLRAGRVPVPASFGPYQVDEGLSVELDASGATDPFGEALTFRWDLDGDGAYDDAIGPIVPFDAAGADGPEVRVVSVRVQNESGFAAAASTEIEVSNVPPVIDAGPDRTVAQAADELFVVTIDDVASDTFLVTWDFGDGTDGVGPEIVHAFGELGVYSVTVTVEDDDGGVAVDTLEVTHVNTAPELAIAFEEPVYEGASVTFTATASDAGGDAFVLTWDLGDGNGGEGADVTHTFVDSGAYTVTVTAVDEHDGTTTDSVVVDVRNVAPTFTTSPGLTVGAGRTYTYQAAVTDPGLDVPIWSIETGPPGIEVSAVGLVTWELPPTAFEPVAVVLVADDGDGGRATQEWVITITFDDTDGGGAPDLCELAFGGDPDAPGDDTSDVDGDGLTMAQECLAGSDPTAFSGPDAPVLVSPIDLATWRNPRLSLVVENAPDPDGDIVVYDFQLFVDSDLTELVAETLDVDEEPSGETEGVVDAEPEEDRIYFWRARAKATDVSGPWSEAESFVFNERNQPPARPEAVAPVEYGGDNPPLLRVLNAADPDNERVTYDFDLFSGRSTRDMDRLWGTTGVAEGSGGETAVTVGLELADLSDYTWRARARDASGGVSPFVVVSFYLDTQNSPPLAPVIVQPAGGETIPARDVTYLEWENAVDPDGDRLRYVGELATDDGFRAIVRAFVVDEDPTSETTRAEVLTPLTPHTTYFWRVAAVDDRFTSPYSVATFEVGDPFVNSPPSAPRPVAPVAGSTFIEGESVELIVDNATDADGDALSYTFVLSLDLEMREVIETFGGVSEGTDGTTSLLLEDLHSLRYFWRVRAFDGTDFSQWSPVLGFTVQTPIASPDAGDTGIDAGPDADTDLPRPRATGGQLGGGGGCSATAERPRGGSAFALLALSALFVRRRR